MASDGVWDVMSTRRAVALCQAEYPDATKACQVMVKKAAKRWRKQELTNQTIAADGWNLQLQGVKKAIETGAIAAIKRRHNPKKSS